MAFRFDLQPKLDALLAEQQACERARQRVCDERDGVVRQLREHVDAYEKLTAELEREATSWRVDDTARDASDLERLEQRRVVLERKAQASRSQADALRTRLGFLETIVSQRTLELRDVAGRVLAMESLRDVQRKAWELENQKREQHDIDEASQAAWQARRRENDRRDGTSA